MIKFNLMAKHYILIVDDQHEVRRVLRAGIETLGPDFHVLDLPSAEEALLVLALQRVDLLVADVRLPGISGLELTTKLRKRYPELKIILVTGLTDFEIRKQVAEAGASAFFNKPVPMADFLDAVERTLGIVETLLPQEPIVEEEVEEEPPTSLADQLASLRQELSARAVLLLDERGQSLAQAGEIPAEYQSTSITTDLMAALNAAGKVSYALKAGNLNNQLFFAGVQYEITAVNVGDRYALVLVCDTPQVDDERDYQNQPLKNARNSLLRMLEKLGAPPPPVLEDISPGVPEPEVEDLLEEESTPEVDALFEALSEHKLQPNDVDQFWDTAVENSDPLGGADPGAITFDQAKKLGLAPEEDQD